MDGFIEQHIYGKSDFKVGDKIRAQEEHRLSKNIMTITDISRHGFVRCEYIDTRGHLCPEYVLTERLVGIVFTSAQSPSYDKKYVEELERSMRNFADLLRDDQEIAKQDHPGLNDPFKLP